VNVLKPHLQTTIATLLAREAQPARAPVLLITFIPPLTSWLPGLLHS
jgi:hypothetical protein